VCEVIDTSKKISAKRKGFDIFTEWETGWRFRAAQPAAHDPGACRRLAKGPRIVRAPLRAPRSPAGLLLKRFHPGFGQRMTFLTLRFCAAVAISVAANCVTRKPSEIRTHWPRFRTPASIWDHPNPVD
jgi:hypothetical protein